MSFFISLQLKPPTRNWMKRSAKKRKKNSGKFHDRFFCHMVNKLNYFIFPKVRSEDWSCWGSCLVKGRQINHMWVTINELWKMVSWASYCHFLGLLPTLLFSMSLMINAKAKFINLQSLRDGLTLAQVSHISFFFLWKFGARLSSSENLENDPSMPR